MSGRRRVCPDHSWCVMGQLGDAEHASHHSSAIHDLAPVDEAARQGWWAWLTEKRGDDYVDVEFEGYLPPHRVGVSMSIGLEDLQVLLSIVRDPDGLRALEALALEALT